jgi:hypothetical protein
MHSHRSILMAVFVISLITRALIPAGWMPSSIAGQMVTICNGSGVTQAWLGHDGQIHKDVPDETSPMDDPCVYAAVSMALIYSDELKQTHAPTDPIALHWIARPSIGQGLAAPPPYSTGPPNLI